MKLSWDKRKARRNEREHGISFTLAERALLHGLGVPIDEQFREDEWRTVIVAPLDDGNLSTIIVAIYEDDNDGHNTGLDEQAEGNKVERKTFGRIISTRKAKKVEETLYFASRPKDGL